MENKIFCCANLECADKEPRFTIKTSYIFTQSEYREYAVIADKGMSELICVHCGRAYSLEHCDKEILIPPDHEHDEDEHYL
jgi:hypothetical protein